MPPNKHALLSPSSAERWLSCPASIRAISELPPQEEKESPYALEGTHAHAVAEVLASHHFGIINARQKGGKIGALRRAVDDDASFEDMLAYGDLYVQLLDKIMAEEPNSCIVLEQQLDSGVPHCTGTSDAIIFSESRVHVVDYKYGQGVQVSAVGNPQLRLYGLGALDAYGDVLGDTETVSMTIFQPRKGWQSIDSMSADALRDWRESILPTAELALTDDAPFGPSESACRWCPVAGICRARMEQNIAHDFTRKPDFMTPEEIGDILHALPEITKWASDVKDAALDLAYSQETPIPGWKVVLSGGRRKVTDPPAVIQLLIDAGYPAEQVASLSLKGLGVLDKVVGAEELKQIAGDFLYKDPGKPALVVESDKRAAIQPNTEAQKEFQQ